jgi:hypothetical protein
MIPIDHPQYYAFRLAATIDLQQGAQLQKLANASHTS